MSFNQQGIEFGIESYRDAVRQGERRALRLARISPQPAAGLRLIRKAAEWLGKRRASLNRDIVPGAVLTHGEQASG
jgi:hypothetical protein